MPTRKKRKKARRGLGSERAAVPVGLSGDVAVEVPVPKATTEVIAEKTYVTTEPEVEIRKPATLAQALAAPAVAVVRPSRRVVRKELHERATVPDLFDRPENIKPGRKAWLVFAGSCLRLLGLRSSPTRGSLVHGG